MSGVRVLTAEQYHGDVVGVSRPSLSASIAHTLVANSPRHAWAQHPQLNPDFKRATEDKFDLGTAAHWLLLQGDTADVVTIVDADDWKTKIAREQREAVRAAGRLPLLAKQWDAVQAMVAAAREQLESANVAPPLFTDGAAEQTLVWEDDYGVLCRARLDWIRHDLRAIDDLKTTAASANPRVWSRRTMWSIGCDVQIAFYLRGVAKCFPELREPPAWRYVVIETSPPYELSIVEPDAGILAVGAEKVERAIEKWAECLKTDNWPGYQKTAFRAELPTWVEVEWMEGRAAA